MGLLDRLRNASRTEIVTGTKVLICLCDVKFDGIAKQDLEAYSQYFPTPDLLTLGVAGADELKAAIQRGYDIVHLFCDVNPDGRIAKAGITGTELMDECCASQTKLLWIASDNEGKAYISGFNARGKPLNLVMTIHRNGANFPNFLKKLLSEMYCGETMPVAWNRLCPQIPGSAHSDAPASILYSGRGQIVLKSSRSLSGAPSSGCHR